MRALLLILVLLIAGGIGYLVFLNYFADTVVDVAPPLDTPGQYASDAFGVSFDYDPSYVGVEPLSPTVLAIYDTHTDPAAGQKLMRFEKESGMSLENAIRERFLADATATCSVEITPQPNGYQKAEITYPAPDDPSEPFFMHASLCNEAYARTNGIRYFLYDPRHPDRYYFVDIGQYPLTAREGVAWQDTLSID